MGIFCYKKFNRIVFDSDFILNLFDSTDVKIPITKMFWNGHQHGMGSRWILPYIGTRIMLIFCQEVIKYIRAATSEHHFKYNN